MQTMSILGRVLLSFLVLVACQGDMVTPSAHPLRTNMLKESIRLLEQLQQTEVSCNQMNVTNIFADYEGGDTSEILCKAATVAQESRSCHRRLEGISDNLLGLLWGHRTELKPNPSPANFPPALLPFPEAVSCGSRQHHLPEELPQGITPSPSKRI
ncbi:interleukin 4 [Willisornis vidua]|uniref:Interleukin 4 n=1 Tax=Willisornis vidua TaxID=1566151 RepID=A0ABQ9DVP3_9PASS|nr:interleukin 4 [Willisornis vidua]